MAGVRVVEPVVVVGDIVGTRLILHAEHIGFTSIPVVAVADGDILGVTLHVNHTVALLVVARTMLAVEQVKVMNPDVGIVGVQRQSIVHAANAGKVAELHALTVADEESEAKECSIVANALEGHVHL